LTHVDSRIIPGGDMPPPAADQHKLEGKEGSIMQLHTFAQRLASAALLSTLALGVSAGSAAAASRTDDRAHLNVTVQPGAISPANTFTDTITVSNVGGKPARDSKLSMTFDPAAVWLMNVQLNVPGAWVTNTASNDFQVDLGRIGSHDQSDTLQATFAVRPGYRPSAALTSQVAYRYNDNVDNRSGNVTAILLPAAAAARQSAAQPSAVVVPLGGPVPVSATGFAPNEGLAFWYNDQNGVAQPLYTRHDQIVTDRRHTSETPAGQRQQYEKNGLYLSADAQGMIATSLWTSNLNPGMYSLVVHGTTSGHEAVIFFQIQ
jgi:hypothetical protein